MYDCVACQICLELVTGVDKSGLYSEFESKEERLLPYLRYDVDTRNGGVFLSDSYACGSTENDRGLNSTVRTKHL